MNEMNSETVFYSPQSVVKLANWLDYAIKIGIVTAIIINLTQFRTTHLLVQTFFYYSPNSTLLIILISAVLILVAIVFECLIIYFSLKALKKVLLILMQMEFNSRK